MSESHKGLNSKTRNVTDTHSALLSAAKDKDASPTNTASEEEASFNWIRGINLIVSMASRFFFFLITGSWIWVYMSGRLLLFVFFLIPGWVVMLHYYLSHPHRDICYYIERAPSSSNNTRCSSRHYLDIYLPNRRKKGEKYPVVIFLTGGAWIIGYKMWGALMGRALCPHGMIMVIPDYRNYPGANIEEMLADVDMAIQYVKANISGKWGGDPNNIVLVGQSAGAHLATMVCLRKAVAASIADHERRTGKSPHLTEETPLLRSWWKPTDLRGFIPISCPFNLLLLYTHFKKRGLDYRILDWIFQSNLEKYSPSIILDQLRLRLTPPTENHNVTVELHNEHQQYYFPPTTIIHGANDATVPCQVSHDFHRALRLIFTLKQDRQQSSFFVPEVDLIVYESMTHTDPILEKPFAGDQQLHKDIYKACQKWCEGLDEDFDETIPSCQRVTALPQLFIDVARSCNPF